MTDDQVVSQSKADIVLRQSLVAQFRISNKQDLRFLLRFWRDIDQIATGRDPYGMWTGQPFVDAQGP